MGIPGKAPSPKLGILPRHQGKNAPLPCRREPASSPGGNRLLVFCYRIAQLAEKRGLRKAGSGNQHLLRLVPR